MPSRFFLGMREKCGTAERTIARIATRQHGIVTRPELIGAGLSSASIGRRVEKGGLIPEYPGVYRVGHRAPSREARYMAATKAGGPRTLLCGPAAAHSLGLIKGNAPPPEIVTPRNRRVEGLKVHRCRSLSEKDATTWKGVPVTSPARTLVDLANHMSAEALARACHEAGVLHGTSPRQVEEVLQRKPNALGAAKLRKILRGDEQATLSKLESTFIARLKAARLPLPVTNKPAGTKRVDCRWPEQRLTVELNSYRFHNSRHSWEGDYRREREARARGDEFRRFTWADVFEDERYMVRELRDLLRRPSAG